MYDVVLRHLNRDVLASFFDVGARWADSLIEMAQACDMIITCLPSPAVSATLMEDADAVLAGLKKGKIWIEISWKSRAMKLFQILEPLVKRQCINW